MVDNRGAKRLRGLGLTQSEVAGAVETHQGVVSRWESGARKPDSKRRAALERLYSIGWLLWDEDTEDDPVSAAGEP